MLSDSVLLCSTQALMMSSFGAKKTKKRCCIVILFTKMMSSFGAKHRYETKRVVAQSFGAKDDIIVWCERWCHRLVRNIVTRLKRVVSQS